ncbi:beta subunit of citrate lyase [Camillea tinctor]|nr:beta subunit of citrate lyase [Camillea tinctor]
MATNPNNILRRSLLYVPSSSPRMLAKSLTLTTDNLTYDLEDSVTPSLKAPSRAALLTHLTSLPSRPPGVHDVAVRINGAQTPWHADDVAVLAGCPRVDTIVIPKVQRGKDVNAVARAISSARPASLPPVSLLALIESAHAVTKLGGICKAAPGQLSGLVFAAEDYALDVGVRRTGSLREMLYARSAVVTSARAAGLPCVIDLVCTAYQGEEGVRRLEEECRDGRDLGFNGKQCIHPSQVDTVQRMFAPDEGEVDWAVRVVVANEKAKRAGKGAWTLDGHMIDAPVVGKAGAIIRRASACGMDTQALREKWKNQEPE